MNTVVFYTCIRPNLHYYFLKYGKISKTFSFLDIVILLKFDAQIASESKFQNLPGQNSPGPP